MTTPTKLYCITCNTNGKMYVGLTCRDLDTRWNEHVKAAKGQQPAFKLQHAIRKYGIDAFNKEVLFEYPSLEEAAEAEIQLIAHLNLMREGYNSAPGGDLSPTTGISIPQDVRDKLAEASRAWAAIPANRAKLRERATVMMADPTMRERIASKLRGRPLAESTRIKIGNAHRGRKLSLETKSRIGASNRGNKRPDNTARQLGVPRSDATKAAISAGRLRAAQRRREIAAYSEMSYAGS